jgi:diadenosine tetraphosphate (Ap4A) HIT family hydrolase
MSNCIFCKIVKDKSFSCYRIYENERVLAFLDLFPLSKGHTLVIPKQHYSKFHEVDEETLSEILPVAKKITLALGIKDYNLLQNNGEIANQAIHHVHFHIIPKPNETEGLGIQWPSKKAESSQLEATLESILNNLKNIT